MAPTDPVPPLFVQALRSGGGGWVTDKQVSTLGVAIGAARTLHSRWSRRVRVIDQREHVWFRLPRATRRGSSHG